MITIVDYGIGNLGSVLNMLKRIGVEGEVRSDHEGIKNATKLILPGVGAFDTAMNELKQRGLIDILNQKVVSEKIPVMGICLGMQLLLEKSEEGIENGLGWIAGESRQFKFEDEKLKVPHMGWNYLGSIGNHSILHGLEKAKFYFVHSYYAVPTNPENSLLTTEYGGHFCSGLIKENIFGFQFHPEKSHKFGMKLFENFAKI